MVKKYVSERSKSNNESASRGKYRVVGPTCKKLTVDYTMEFFSLRWNVCPLSCNHRKTKLRNWIPNSFLTCDEQNNFSKPLNRPFARWRLFYYYDQNSFRFSFHILNLVIQWGFNNKSSNLHKKAKAWRILVVVVKWRHRVNALSTLSLAKYPVSRWRKDMRQGEGG